MRTKYKKDLYELNWHNIYSRPDLQTRAGVLKLREIYTSFEKYSYNIDEALAFTDAAYNGGIRGVNEERRACLLTKGCDHTKWFGNTELFCLKSKVALYGNRSACQINRHHVQDVLNIRAKKYEPLFK